MAWFVALRTVKGHGFDPTEAHIGPKNNLNS